MKPMTISTETTETYSSISNFFIDYYMADANGEFVKIYIYLIRLLTNNKPFTVTEIADHFNMTDKDICRAIKYWVSKDVLRLNMDENNQPVSIVILPLKKLDVPSKSSTDVISILKNDTVESNTTYNSSAQANSSERNTYQSAAIRKRQPDYSAETERSVPLKKELTSDVMNSLLRDSNWEDLVYIVNTIFGKNLSQTEITTLYYIKNELNFDCDLIEYLIDYCFRKGKKSMRYIEAVAVAWYSDGICTKEQAKEQCSITAELGQKVLKALGINRSLLANAELEYIKTWSRDMNFSDEIILKACDKAITAKPHSVNFGYVHGILDAWSKKNVKTLADIEQLDKEHSDKKNSQQSGSQNSGSGKVSNFNTFTQSKMDKEMAQMEKLLLQEVNK